MVLLQTCPISCPKVDLRNGAQPDNPIERQQKLFSASPPRLYASHGDPRFLNAPPRSTFDREGRIRGDLSSQTCEVKANSTIQKGDDMASQFALVTEHPAELDFSWQKNSQDAVTTWRFAQPARDWSTPQKN